MFRIIMILLIFVHQSMAQIWAISDILPSGYDPKSSPNPNGVTDVNMSITINDLVAVTESASSFQLDMTLKLQWFETRLNLSKSLSDQLLEPNSTINSLLIDSSYATKFWIPDIYFQNALSVSIVNSGLNIQFLAIGLDQNITYTVRLSGTFMCKMDLTAYPQDYQYCSLEAVSLTQTADNLVIHWNQFDTGHGSYPKFRIRTSFLSTCVRTIISGDYSCKGATLKLVRRVGYYVLRVYAPTFLSVIIPFVGFWIPIIGWPARVNIVVTPLLALITQDISLNNDIGVAYVVAIHWWMIFCQIFVYFALVEYAVAISWAHFVNEKKALKATEMGQKGTVIVSGYYFGNKGWWSQLGQIMDKILKAFFGDINFHKDPLMRNKVDYCSRILFTFMWIVFCLLYIFSTICPWAANYD